MNILIADDEPLLREAFVNLLREENVGRIYEAADGAEALHILQTQVVHLAFLDIRMPLLDGLEVIRQAGNVKAAFYVLTGYSEFEYARNAIALHVRDYLLKPLRASTLHGIIEKEKALLSAAREAERKARSIRLTQAFGTGYGKGEPDEMVFPVFCAGYPCESAIKAFVEQLCGFFEEEVDCILTEEASATIYVFFGLKAPLMKESFSPLFQAHKNAMHIIIPDTLIPLARLADTIRAFHQSARAFAVAKEESAIVIQYETDGTGLFPQILKYVEVNCEKELSLHMLGEVFNLSPNYLSTQFKQFSGQGFSEYLADRRIEKAVRLLNSTSRTVKEIANQVGYYSISHFIKLFTKHKGCSPAEYRVQKESGRRKTD